jgi:hypothetical protein
MALTFNCIASTTLADPATGIIMSSIPSGYTDLRIYASIREATADNVYFRLNAASNTLSEMSLATRGTDSQNYTSQDATVINLTGFTGNWPDPMLFEIHIPEYSVNQPKQVFYRSWCSQTSSGSFGYSIANTASNVNVSSIQIFTQSGVNMLAGTKISIYGILKA